MNADEFFRFFVFVFFFFVSFIYLLLQVYSVPYAPSIEFSFSLSLTSSMDLAVRKACDAVVPLLMDSYLQETGFLISAQDQFQYNRLVSQLAHDRGLAVGLTNDLGQTQALAPYFDFLIAQQPFDLGGTDVYYGGVASSSQSLPLAAMNEFIRLTKPVYGMQ
jgi:hypothetical protein